jgi:hypothetical protein
MIYHDLIHDISWFIAIHVLVTCSHVDSAANQRLVGLWIKLYCNCYPCDTSIIFSGSQLLASIALKSVISCAGNVFYSVLSQLFHVVSMFFILYYIHGLRNNLRVDDLKVFVLDEASFLYDFPNCFFNASKDFKGYVLWCFVRR